MGPFSCKVNRGVDESSPSFGCERSFMFSEISSADTPRTGRRGSSVARQRTFHGAAFLLRRRGCTTKGKNCEIRQSAPVVYASGDDYVLQRGCRTHRGSRTFLPSVSDAGATSRLGLLLGLDVRSVAVADASVTSQLSPR